MALETLEHFLGRIDQASEEQYSSEFDSADSSQLEEAVLVRSALPYYESQANICDLAGQ